MRLKELYEKYESMSNDEINSRVSKIDQRRGLDYTANSEYIFMAILRRGWIPEIHKATIANERGVLLMVDGWEQLVEIDNDVQVTRERISRALCVCFMIAYDAWIERKDEK